MARMARVVIPDVPHHVTQRGNRRQTTFFSDLDFQYYISLVATAAHRADTKIWAYCLMPNHVHFVMVPSHSDGLRKTFSEAHRRYTCHVNRREGWQGHLWQERFHSFPMDEGHLVSAVRYVERNPVAADLAKHPQDWRWSSATAHLQGHDDRLVTVKPMLDRVGNWAAYIDESSSQREKEQINKHSSTGRPLGNAEFVTGLEALTGRTLAPQKPGRKAAAQS